MANTSPQTSTLSYATLNDHLLGSIATEEQGGKIPESGSDSESLRQSELKNCYKESFMKSKYVYRFKILISLCAVTPKAFVDTIMVCLACSGAITGWNVKKKEIQILCLAPQLSLFSPLVSRRVKTRAVCACVDGVNADADQNGPDECCNPFIFLYLHHYRESSSGCTKAW